MFPGAAAKNRPAVGASTHCQWQDQKVTALGAPTHRTNLTIRISLAQIVTRIHDFEVDELDHMRPSQSHTRNFRESHEINNDENPQLGYKILVEGTGIFRIDQTIELLEEHKKNLQNYSAVNLLINSGANIHIDNNLALITAVYYRRTRIAKILLKHGADPHAYNDYAINWAVIRNDIELMVEMNKYNLAKMVEKFINKLLVTEKI